MDLAEIIDFVKSNIEPTRDISDKDSYRCAAYLRDGLYIPCMVIADAPTRTALALRRFDELRKEERGFFGKRKPAGGLSYEGVVTTFVTTGNRINAFDIERVEPSPFAIPVARYAEMHGETSMSWTQFVGVMQDGKEFSFGTTYLTEFFEMPDGYAATDLQRLIAHERREGRLYRERPFFMCYVDGL